MKTLIFLATLLTFTACASSSQKIESVRDAAKRGDGDIESGVYNNAENENLLVVSQTLRSKIEEVRAENQKLDDAIHQEQLRSKSITQETNILEARAAQVANKKRSVANVKTRNVRRIITTTEETEE